MKFLCLGSNETKTSSDRNESTDPPIMQPIQPPSIKGNITWETVIVNNKEYKIDGECIQPYKRVVSHGGKRL